MDDWLGDGSDTVDGDGTLSDREFDLFSGDEGGDDDDDSDDDDVNGGTGRFANDLYRGRDGAQLFSGSSGGESSDAPDGEQNGRPPFLAVAAFLQTIATRRRARLGALSQRAEAREGMARHDSDDGESDTSSELADFS